METSGKKEGTNISKVILTGVASHNLNHIVFEMMTKGICNCFLKAVTYKHVNSLTQ